MKAILFLFSSVIIILSFYFFAVFAPYHLYDSVIVEGYQSDYYSIRPHDKNWHKVDSEYAKGQELVINEETNLWRTFHFSHFKIPFPLNHPVVIVVPHIDFEGRYDELGAKFLDRQEQESGSFLVQRPVDFDRSFNKHKVFNLPYFKAYLRTKKTMEIWRDIFSKDITLPNRGDLSIVDYLNELKAIDYRELVYNLYILKLRDRVLPINTVAFAYDNETGIGRIKMTSDDELYTQEKFFILNKDLVYVLDYRWKNEDVVAEVIRKRILNEFKYLESSEDSTHAIYAQYKKLSYKDRIDQKGMVYLYAAWSHVPKERGFLKEMIRFLERGKGNEVYIHPLYNYAYKLFGTNFSIDSKKRKETQEERLKRLTKEEGLKEYENISKERIESGDIKFESEEKKIKFFLDRAKESGEDIDDFDNTLSLP